MKDIRWWDLQWHNPSSDHQVLLVAGGMDSFRYSYIDSTELLFPGKVNRKIANIRSSFLCKTASLLLAGAYMWSSGPKLARKVQDARAINAYKSSLLCHYFDYHWSILAKVMTMICNRSWCDRSNRSGHCNKQHARFSEEESQDLDHT